MKLKNNKKGFTLVELLAVIIVLSLILVLIVPNVLNNMNNARRRTVAMYGQILVSNAQTIYQNFILMGTEDADSSRLIPNSTSNPTSYCININQLGLQNTGTYVGYIIITPSTAGVQYDLHMTDKATYVVNKENAQTGISSAANGGDVQSGSTITAPTGYAGCYSAS